MCLSNCTDTTHVFLALKVGLKYAHLLSKASASKNCCYNSKKKSRPPKRKIIPTKRRGGSGLRWLTARDPNFNSAKIIKSFDTETLAVEETEMGNCPLSFCPLRHKWRGKGEEIPSLRRLFLFVPPPHRSQLAIASRYFSNNSLENFANYQQLLDKNGSSSDREKYLRSVSNFIYFYKRKAQLRWSFNTFEQIQTSTLFRQKKSFSTKTKFSSSLFFSSIPLFSPI